MLRNIANLVPPFEPGGGQHGTSAAIEFAVNALAVSNIVVMGHGRCGGIHAALDPSAAPLAPGAFIGKWLSLLKPVAEQVGTYSAMTAAERQTTLERLGVRNSIANLRTFPRIKALEDQGELVLHGAWFDVSTGELWAMNKDTGDFEKPEIG